MDEKLIDEMTVPELRKEVEARVRRVPAAFQNWGVERVRQFKDAVLRAQKHAAGGKEHLLRPSVKLLRTFW